MKLQTLFLLELLVVLQGTFSLSLLVNTHTGPIKGTTKTVHGALVQEFLGIPYAEPPLRSQRFLKAKPVKPWTKILHATHLPPACMQYTTYPFPWADDLPGKSEDCLYLNVYAPGSSTKGNKLPVMFWIHGGGYLTGSSRMDVYNASALVLLGDIIVVTINYRLGVFGFLTSNTADAPGNIGTYDMLMALRWVNANIEAFGGDKTQITLAGESTGSISISLFCVSPLTKGLFNKAIMESGSAVVFSQNQLKSNLNVSQQVAKVVGCANDSRTIQSHPESVVDCLRNQNSFSLAYALWSLNPTAASSLWFQYGDDLFPSNILDDIRNGNFHNVSLLIGNVRDEGSPFITTANPKTFGFFGQKDPVINKTYANQLIVNFLSKIYFENPELYAKYYLDKVNDNDYHGIRRQSYTAIGDAMFLCPSVYFAESYAKRKNDVYFYFFDHRPSNTPWARWMGVPHYEEVQFVFGRPILRPQLYNLDEIELSKRMVVLWTNFVKNGVPSNSFHWPKYSKEQHDFVYLDTTFRRVKYDQNSFSLAYAFRSLYPSSPVGLWPQFGDDLFPSNSLDNIRNGNFHNVSLLIGNNRDEGSALMTTSYPETFGFFGQKDPEINKTYASQVIVNFLSNIYFENPEMYAKYYLDKVDDEDYYNIRRQTFTAVGDATFLCPTVYFAESYATRKNDVYFYFFVHRPSNTPWAWWMGVTIYEEVQFVFGRPILKPQLYSPDEIELSMELVTLWTNFVKNGLPSNFFQWPKYSKENHETLYLDTAFRENVYGTFPRPRLNNCNFLRNHYVF